MKELTIEEQYQKMEHKEHALNLPDTYIGSVEEAEDQMWVPQMITPPPREDDNDDDDDDLEAELMMKQKKIRYVPGLYKIYDEVLVNAIDHWTRMGERIKLQQLIKKGKAEETPEVTKKMKFKPVKTIKVEIDADANTISVYNDGDGLPVVEHKEYKVYVPELVFSQFLTSGNYKGANVNQTKIIGGKNGYGSKLAALFSHSFTIETVDFNRKLKYVQTYTENLNVIGKPEITEYKGMPYTKITFSPDLARFGLEKLTDDILLLFQKRVYDAAGWCTGVNVSYNKKLIDIKDFNQYVDMYLGKNKVARKRHFLKVNDRWEICATYSDDHEFQQVSIVNGVLTSKGGRHVNYLADQIGRKLAKDILVDKTPISTKAVKSNLWIFIRAIIEDPAFGSQTKEEMTSQVSQFGSKCEISTEDIRKIGAVGIKQRARQLATFKETTTSKATDGKKVGRVSDIDKLDDAHYAGHKTYSKNCILILTEGDSAKSFATNGLKALSEERRKFFGVFPLKGKLLNVRDASQKSINGNDEIKNLKKILGLKADDTYASPDSINNLRYGQIRIATDSDLDGDHIKGLLFNFIHKFWPNLMKMPNFITSIITPIVICWKTRKNGRKTEKYNVTNFYSENSYKKWCLENNNGRGWHRRYFKGLATFTDEQSQVSFKENKVITYIRDEEIEDSDNMTDSSINLAFLKTNADKRKDWLAEADLEKVNEYNITEETYSDFINHRMVHFSWYDTYRSIPNICDGLKPSLRKIMFFALRKLRTNQELKVSQLGGKVSADTEYHHGEKSLEGAICGLAQNFVGANNINLLVPSGMFGTRNKNGKDMGSSRYIYTGIESLTKLIFRDEDRMLYNYQVEDNNVIEPEWYLPIIPMVLINGATGIGTGWSTDIPKHNPLDIIQSLRVLLDGRKLSDIDPTPWYRGFKGTIEKKDNGGYACIGKYQVSRDKLIITEIPFDISYDSYDSFLSGFLDADENDPKVKKNSYVYHVFKDYIFDKASGKITITFKRGGLANLLSTGVEKFEKIFKLRTSISKSNMVLFSPNIEIKKYQSVNQIIEEYFEERFKFYQKRHELLLAELEYNLLKTSSKYKFIIEESKDDDTGIKITNVPLQEAIQILENAGFKKFTSKFDPSSIVGKKSLLEEDKVEGDEEDEVGSFNYLLSMTIKSKTKESLEKLAEQIDDYNQELQYYKNTTPSKIWANDLDELEEAYIDWIKDWYAEKQFEIPDFKPKPNIVFNGNLSSLRRSSKTN